MNRSLILLDKILDVPHGEGSLRRRRCSTAVVTDDDPRRGRGIEVDMQTRSLIKIL